MEIKYIDTEQRNDRTEHIDELNTLEMIRLINEEDRGVALAVQKVLEPIAHAVDLITEHLKQGGRLIYCGCGTSGRLGVLDAVECPPTYSTDPSVVQGLIAGGKEAVFCAVEGAEDNDELGRKDLEKIAFGKEDVLVGIAASGRTPYVIGAMQYAKSIGAATVAVTCCKSSKIGQIADIEIAPNPGPEVITGSTRMKSGTAQKMILNMLSTGTMIKLGKVYGNLMVDVKPSNEKLVQRCISIVCTVTHVSEEEAIHALQHCEFSPKIAIVMIRCQVDYSRAKELLELAEGRIAVAIKLEMETRTVG